MAAYMLNACRVVLPHLRWRLLFLESMTDASDWGEDLGRVEAGDPREGELVRAMPAKAAACREWERPVGSTREPRLFLCELPAFLRLS